MKANSTTAKTDMTKEQWMAMSKQEQEIEWKKWMGTKSDPSWDKGATTEPVENCIDDSMCRASTAALERAQAHKGRPLKILCMHGGGMTADGFEIMLKDLHTTLAPLVEFVFAQSPNEHWMGDVQKQGPHAAGWWEESVRHLEDMIAKLGPFDGVLGYSMGSASALSLLAVVPHGTFQFAVLCCGYTPTNDEQVMRQLEACRPLKTPSLHVLGRTDNCIPNDYSMLCVPYFDEGCVELLKHPGSHDVPRELHYLGQLAAFLLLFAEPGIGSR